MGRYSAARGWCPRKLEAYAPALTPIAVFRSGAAASPLKSWRSLDFTFDKEVGPSASTGASKTFSKQLPGNLPCTGGGSVKVSGNFSIGVNPVLKASFSFFKIKTASFAVTGSATASVGFEANGSAACDASTTIGPVRFATFEGTVGPFPVVVVLQGEIDVNGTLTAGANATGGITATGSVTGGVSYDSSVKKNGGFAAITGKSLTIQESPKLTMMGTAGASGTVTPKLQALLYGLTGPQLSLTTGLELRANTSWNPWWTLDVPLEVDASLVAPKLGLDNGPTVAVYPRKTFPLDQAGGRFNGAASVTITNPGSQMSTVGSPVSLQIQASDTDGGTLSYSATGLPAPLTINPSTGLITGAPKTAGSSTVTITATDASGPSGSTQFNWTIKPSGGGSKAAQVSVGDSFACALLMTGSVDCWGLNDFGQLGDGQSGFATSSSIPVTVTGITNATAIAVGGADACAVLAGGSTECWGGNFDGQLGNGTTNGSPTWVSVNGITNATTISLVENSTCARRLRPVEWTVGAITKAGSLATARQPARVAAPTDPAAQHLSR